MKKTDVYVVVDTPKKAKKLKGVLDMFGENVYSLRFKYCAMGSLYKDEWHSGSTPPKNKTEVSIKELRNILAKEHLKANDVVIVKNDWGKWILKLTGNNIDYFEHSVSIDLEDNSFSDFKHTIEYGNFIRYATEEEKALLEPKKELEVGKWYKSWNDSYNGYDLSYCTGTGTDYGFHAENNNWFEKQYWIKNSMTSEWQEATTQEVEKALIEEAKRRGFVNGGVGNNSNIHDKKLKDCELFFNNKYEFDEKDNLLRIILDADTTWTVFKDGQWATIFEQVNFTDSDIAIVERLHDALLDMHGYSLESKLLTDAIMLANKIKSNIK